ncbi:MAG: hypothetical protein JWN70_5717 [Planctomycetaceae bacterium]|nr:hypothetical protein [Planctomycetaceae bacterium]
MLYNLNHFRRQLPISHVIGWAGKIRTLHADQRGTISVLSVITLVMLTMLMGMILNVGEQIDDKIRMQNAADAATYSSGVVVARGMNTIAFTNHLLCETFALTAYYREGKDRYAESLVPEILDAWQTVGTQLGTAQFQLFKDMQPAIAPKIELERKMVKAFGDMTAVKSKILLPALQTILGVSALANQSGGGGISQEEAAATHLIPVFQRAVVQAVPQAAVAVTQEISRRNTAVRGSGNPQCVLWNTRNEALIAHNQLDPYARLLPALDPTYEGPDYVYLKASEAGMYLARATGKRRDLSAHYLRAWNMQNAWDAPNADLLPFDRDNIHFDYRGGRVSAKMSQFINLWRGFTQAKLTLLLEQEYPNTNLPHMIRMQDPGITQQQYLENEFTFVAAVYRKQRKPTMPGMYRTPITGDSLAFARVSVYLPRPRYVTWQGCPNFHCYYGAKTTCGNPYCRDDWPEEWSLFSQHWAAKMTPTSAESTVGLLQTSPQAYAPGVTLPNFSSLQIQDLKAINTH